MAKEVSNPVEWQEPDKGQNAGIGSWNRPNSPYDNFMESEGVPIYRGIGTQRVQELPFKPWKRLGGRGTFIQLYGTEGLWGCYVVEIARRRWPQGRAPYVRRDLFSRRRPRHHRSLGRRFGA